MLSFEEFNNLYCLVRRNVAAEAVSTYILAHLSDVQHEEHMAKLDRQHHELMKALEKLDHPRTIIPSDIPYPRREHEG